MNERDLDKNPYSPDEQRVAQFFFERGTGGGDDPIGALIASHEYLIAERKLGLAATPRKSVIEECAKFFDNEGSGTVAEKLRALCRFPTCDLVNCQCSVSRPHHSPAENTGK